MEIQFQGFSPVFSIVLILLLFGSVLFTVWWSYSHLASLKPVKRWGMILLRSGALFILIMLLLNPFIQYRDVEVNNPEIAVYIDNSKSLSVVRGDYEGSGQYRELIDSFSFDGFENVTFSYYLFDDHVEQTDSPDPDLEGGLTNLDEVVRHLRDQAGQPSAAILFSDGIITRGRDPVFAAGELSIPLITVPAGDTSMARDIAVTEVMTNRTGYTNTVQPVEVTIRHHGFTGEPVAVRLQENDDILESDQVVMGSSPSSHTLRFELEFEDPGIHEYEIVTPPLDGEYTDQNNRFPFIVDVLDDKTRIVHFAFEIHPDVKSIRSILQTDQSLDVITRTWSGDAFIEGQIEDIPDDDIDLVIVHGPLPESMADFDNFIDSRPILQFISPASSPDEYVIPFNLTNPEPAPDIQLRQNNLIQSHPILETESIPASGQPRLFSRNGTYRVPVTSNVLFFANRAGAETDIPVIVTQETGNVRQSVVNAYNWYSYTLNSSETTRQFAQSLIANLVSWTSTNPDHRLLKIAPDRGIFNETETVSFQASLNNESGEPESDAVIEVVVSDEASNEQNFTMRNEGQGYYGLEIGRLASGSYSFSAEARKSGRVIDRQDGEFSVELSNIEFINTQRNDNLMRQLAEVTNGLFMGNNSVEYLRTEMENLALLEPTEEQRILYRFLYENVWWFVLVVLMLSGEWLLRRSAALP